MLYLVINLILAGFLLWFSSYIDSKNKDQVGNLEFVRMIMVLGLETLLMAVCILSTIMNNVRLTSFIGRITLFLLCFFNVLLVMYLSVFPYGKHKKSSIILRVLLIVASVYVPVFGIEEFNASMQTGLDVTGRIVSVGGFEINLFTTYANIFCLFLPAIAFLQMVIRAIKTKSKIIKQQIFLGALSLIGGLVVIIILEIASLKIPAYMLLLSGAFTVIILLVHNAQRLSSLIDAKTIGRWLFKFSYVYAVAAILVGLVFAALLPVSKKSPALFVLGAAVVLAVVFSIAAILDRFMRKVSRVRDNDYERLFEAELASIDYDKSSEEIINQFVDIFEKNLDTSFVDVLIESADSKKLSTVYSSLEHSFEISLDNPIFDVMLNARRSIVFRGHETSVHVLSTGQKHFAKMFSESGSDAAILLHEGRHIFGMILLGPKRLQNVFTAYDYSVFNKLYSSLFVIGYYMKNIANESIVGTVAREISMSGQIIESIQRNIDPIKNPKADIGYLSVAARTLGGSFVDFIRLTDTRNIIVMGSVSGKGINASMSMVILKSIIRTFLNETKDFKQLVQKVNAFIRFNLPKGTFFAGAFVLTDFAENTMYYINCGIPALFMYTQAYNNVIEIQGDGRVLGFASDITKLVKVKRVKLNPGDIIMGCSEGLFASQSLRGDYFTKGMVQKLVLDNLAYPADRMTQFLHQSLLDFTSKELENDISIVVLKYLEHSSVGEL